eukprot:m.11024 g.11024  ORF g.11024 m.11024 type:complete len:92 (-) comp6802_c0_seq1:1455-1730(-)
MIGVLCLFVFAVGVVIRVGVSFGPYSGYNKPPMFGDFEAQRHWMEVLCFLLPNQIYSKPINLSGSTPSFLTFHANVVVFSCVSDHHVTACP